MMRTLLSITLYSSDSDAHITALVVCPEIEIFLKVDEKKGCWCPQYVRTEAFWNLVRDILNIRTYHGAEDGYWPEPEINDIDHMETEHGVTLYLLTRLGDRIVEYNMSMRKEIHVEFSGDIVHLSIDLEDIPDAVKDLIRQDHEEWEEIQEEKIQKEIQARKKKARNV